MLFWLHVEKFYFYFQDITTVSREFSKGSWSNMKIYFTFNYNKMTINSRFEVNNPKNFLGKSRSQQTCKIPHLYRSHPKSTLKSLMY